MTEAEAYAKIEGLARDARERGHRYLKLTIGRKRNATFGERVRVFPGVTGEFLCVNEQPDGSLRAVVDVKVDDLERWLKRHDDWRAK